jgi:23S rRNA pseudouridine2605 synthase
MNNKEGNNKRSGSRPSSSRTSSNKPKPAMQKRAQGPKKAKINTKVAEVVTDKVEKKANQAPKRPKVKDEIRLNKYISIQGFALVVTLIYIFSLVL